MLEKLFLQLDRFQERLSTHWREHSNRRTLLALLLIGSLSCYVYLYAIRPPDNFPINQLVTVSPDTNLKEIATKLQQDGVIRSALAFRVLETIMGHEHELRAGDYLFKQPIGVYAIARAIAIGAYGLEPMRFRVPEGATTKQMAIIFSTLQRFNPAHFVSEAQPQEGYLFPDTYFFLPNATEDTIVQALHQNFDEHIGQINTLVASSGKSESDVVKMASILEREASNTKDRRMIAGVLWNRLARGMPLQVDVTFLYTIGKGTFQLTTKDLTTNSPYNTYINKGLPPTPIGSPSLDSLIAAVTPIKSNDLYFLADKNGVTHYCKTYSCQLANKNRYF